MTSSDEHPIGSEVARQADLGAYPALRARGVFDMEAVEVRRGTSDGAVGGLSH
jgi:hypothetical protein